jgi:hypothetical protein
VSDSPPTPPQQLSPEVVERLAEQSPTALRDLARYAEALADYRERTAADGDDHDEPADTPDDVPSKATLTVKTINDNRYYYWQ